MFRGFTDNGLISTVLAGLYVIHLNIRTSSMQKNATRYLCSYNNFLMSGGLVGESFSSPVSNMVSVLSPSLNRWLPLPPMNKQRLGHGTCTVGDDTLMVVGGWDGSSSLDSVEVLKF